MSGAVRALLILFTDLNSQTSYFGATCVLNVQKWVTFFPSFLGSAQHASIPGFSVPPCVLPCVPDFIARFRETKRQV